MTLVLIYRSRAGREVEHVFHIVISYSSFFFYKMDARSFFYYFAFLNDIEEVVFFFNILDTDPLLVYILNFLRLSFST